MSLKIICSGYLLRYPLGGQSWHHLQYLAGFKQFGYEVIYFEDYGWSDSCYDPNRNKMTGDPSYGIEYWENLLRDFNLVDKWCYIAENGTNYGMPREELAQACRESDIYFNLSNINWIPELELCTRRILIDTDPVFTQIGGHGSGGEFSKYQALFTYGENVHQPNCTMPTGGAKWMPTRQPVVLDLWKVEMGNSVSSFTTVMNWSAYGERNYEGQIYGQKNREFEPFFSLPHETNEPMELAVAGVPATEKSRLIAGGWQLTDPFKATRNPQTYQDYLKTSRDEFSVAKHAYVTTGSGWFSDRSTGYLASGRPIIVQDTGFSSNLPCGIGLCAFSNKNQATIGVKQIADDYEKHCRAARQIAEDYFDARKVLTELLERSV